MASSVTHPPKCSPGNAYRKVGLVHLGTRLTGFTLLLKSLIVYIINLYVLYALRRYSCLSSRFYAAIAWTLLGEPVASRSTVPAEAQAKCFLARLNNWRAIAEA